MNTPLATELAHLHAELQRSPHVDAESRALLTQVMRDIEQLLGNSPASSAGEGLNDRVNELAARFEADHPSLGAAIARVVDALAKAGI